MARDARSNHYINETIEKKDNKGILSVYFDTHHIILVGARVNTANTNAILMTAVLALHYHIHLHLLSDSYWPRRLNGLTSLTLAIRRVKLYSVRRIQ